MAGSGGAVPPDDVACGGALARPVLQGTVPLLLKTEPAVRAGHAAGAAGRSFGGAQQQLGRHGASTASWFLADLAFDRSAPGDAVPLRREALALARELDDRSFVAPQLEGFGEAAAAGGDPQRALRLAGAAAALREATGTPPTAPEQARLARWLAPLAATVSDDVRTRSWAEGQGMTREDAVMYALEDAPDAV